MNARIRGAEYFYTTVKDRPGEAYRFLSQLATAEVNLLAFSAIPIGPEHTQLVLFPERTESLTRLAEKNALLLTAPQHAFLVQGDNRLGTVTDIHSKLLDAQINVYACSGVADGNGCYGYVLYVKDDSYKRAAHVLGVDQGPLPNIETF